MLAVIVLALLGLAAALWPLWFGLGMDWLVRRSTNEKREAKRQEALRLRGAAADQFRDKVHSELDRLRGTVVGSRLALLNTVSALLEPMHYGAGVEGAVCVYLDAHSRVLDIHHWVGDDMSVPMPIGDIVAHAVAVRAKGVAVAHNHPYDSPVPSDQDVWHCAELVDALEGAGISLIEDYVWCHNKYKSVLKTRRFKELAGPI